MLDGYWQQAYAGYCRACWNAGALINQPSGDPGGERQVNGKRYYVLRNTNGILRAFRITRNYKLRHIEKYPEELEEY